MSILRVEHIEKAFETDTPIKDISFELREGDVVSVIGPSGTGKSTLLRTLNMLSAPTKGKIYFHDECVNRGGYNLNNLRRRVGMVFQSFQLFSHKTVLETIIMAPMDLLGLGRQEAEERACGLLRQVGLYAKKDNYPDELSGGQKQRVAIARCLAMEPEVILFDEPTSALDPTMVDEVKNIIEDLAKAGKTMMIVTHEMEFARKIANRVFYLDQGGIYEEGTPEEIFEHPKRERTVAFMKKSRNFRREIDMSDVNLTAVLDAVMQYGRKTGFSQKLTYRIALLTEEMLTGIAKTEARNALLRIEPGTETDGPRVHFFYDGETGNILCDELSEKIVGTFGKDLRFAENEEGYAAHVSMTVARS